MDKTEPSRETPEYQKGRHRKTKQGRQIDLVREPILPALVRLSVPIMASAFLGTAYNLTDMAWVGTLGSGAVASVGVGGMYHWLSGGLIMLARMGGQVLTGQALGSGDREQAGRNARAAVQLGVLLGVLYGLLCFVFARPLVAYFRLSGETAVRDAETYLKITGGLVLFFFMSYLLTGLFNAQGDSRTPFRANLTGLVFNMVLDPFLIRGIGPAPRLGVAGAAWATVISQGLVLLCLVQNIFSKAGEENVLRGGSLFAIEDAGVYREIVRIGLPASAQNMIYTGISFVLGRLVALWGDHALAAQRLCNQIESLAWNISDGFAAAINAFAAQNFGAKQYRRIREGYRISFRFLGTWGLFITALFLLAAEPMAGIFFHEPEAFSVTVSYLHIIAVCEAFMCLEVMTVGALSGLGLTRLCSKVSILLTGARIPLAYLLCRTSLGLDGIWWAYSVSSVAKGTVFYLLFRKIAGEQLRGPE